MRAHQAASSASSAREKWTRPLVVGPSPVITPSRTMVRAWAAVLRQEIGVSMAPIGSADLGTRGRHRLHFSFSCSGPAFPCGRKRVVNDSKPHREIFRWLPIGRCDLPQRFTAPAIAGRSGVVRRINGNIGAIQGSETIMVFSLAGQRLGKKMLGVPAWRRRIFPFCGSRFRCAVRARYICARRIHPAT